METKKAPTLKDVAERAGVHRSAVAAVLNGGRVTARVSDATRERIVSVANELKYSPNSIARGLTTRRFNSVGVTGQYFDPTWIISDYYTTSVIAGIVGGAHKSGYSTTMFHRLWQDAKHSAPMFRGQGIDGFLIIAPDLTSDFVPALAALGLPLVVISSPSDHWGVPSVGVDNRKAVKLVVDHLVALGHRRVAHLTDEIPQYDWVMLRESFLAVMADAGLSVPPDYCRVLHNSFADRGFYQYTRYLLSLPEPPTAIFAPNDMVAMEAMEAARDLGVEIPGRISIVGFNDDRVSRWLTPPMTTVRYDIVEMAQTAARMLIRLIEGETVPTVMQLFEPELVVRGSTAKPPA